ncbi:Longevity-assurance protein [Dirofilaria immitis]|nr:Longevity-assurance protein [Dirofilaria immitis]
MFWDEQQWFPQGISWNDLKSNNTIRYPDIWELTYAMKYSFVLLLLRLAVECFIFLPIGCLFGMIKEPWWIRVKGHLNLYQSKRKFKRVSEAAWRFLFYLCIWLYGFYVLFDQPQLYDVTECWRNWPHHPLTNGVWWYYVIETAFYCSLIISSLLFDIRRADFIQMTFHHIITIMLLSLSFADYQWQNLRQPPLVPRLFVAMLLCLMVLHIYWTFIILKVAQKSVQSSHDINDIREESDDEVSDSSSENVDAAVKNNMKGKKIE